MINKYVVYKRIFKQTKEIDAKIITMDELNRLGFGNAEIKERGIAFIIDYNFGTIVVNIFNTLEQAKENIECFKVRYSL